jgi:UDP-glucose 4-epimerase
MIGAKQVLVTGATGFLGPYVVSALQKSGWSVRVAGRRKVESVTCDTTVVGPIDGGTRWDAALAGVDAVVHLAARAHQSRASTADARTIYREVNTAGTLHLAKSAVGRVRQFVFLSTILVNGSNTDGRGPFAEDDAYDPQTIYAQSKAAAEIGLRELSASASLPTTIVRPPLIYGARAKGNFALLVRAVKAGLPLPLGAARNRRAFAAAENVAGFLAHSLDRPGATDGVFIVADDEQVSTTDFVWRIAAALDKRIYQPALSPDLIRWAFRALGRRSFGDSLLGSLEVKTTKAKDSGWHPDVTLDAGLRSAFSSDARDALPRGA